MFQSWLHYITPVLGSTKAPSLDIYSVPLDIYSVTLDIYSRGFTCLSLLTTISESLLINSAYFAYSTYKYYSF